MFLINRSQTKDILLVQLDYNLVSGVDKPPLKTGWLARYSSPPGLIQLVGEFVMKHSNKLLSAIAVCLLFDASAAIGADTCPFGLIANRQLADIIVPAGQNCVIYNVTARQGISATNAGFIVISESEIGGDVEVRGSAGIAITESRLSANLIVDDNDAVAIIDNVVHRGSILVTGNIAADVLQNRAGDAIVCENNGRVDARFNHANGEEKCERHNN
jgi:hypothetical protein